MRVNVPPQARISNPPSIPSHENVFGYESTNEGMLIRKANPDEYYSGKNNDTIGPG